MLAPLSQIASLCQFAKLPFRLVAASRPLARPADAAIRRCPVPRRARVFGQPPGGGIGRWFGHSAFPISRSVDYSSAKSWRAYVQCNLIATGITEGHVFLRNFKEHVSVPEACGCDPSSAAPCGSDRPPDPLGGGRHRQVGDAERRQRIQYRGHHGRRRRDGAALADPLDAERVGIPGRTGLKSTEMVGRSSARGIR